MAIVATDIKFYLSGGASNADPLLALGGAISSTQAGTNIFANVSSSDAASGRTYYRCVYVKNTHATLTLESAKVWFQANTPSTTTAATMALAGEGLNATAETISDQYTAPSGESFSAPSSSGTALSLTNIPAGQYYAVWLKVVVDASSPAYSNDGFTMRVLGDTAA
jgi:hypothetical protein